MALTWARIAFIPLIVGVFYVPDWIAGPHVKNLLACVMFVIAAVTDALDREIAPLGIAHWTHPKGGYFVSLDALPGTARRTLQLCKEAGVTMTGAGAAFPYGKDPQDSNIRIAPSLPPVEELEQAIQVLCACLKLSALEEYLK